MTAKFGTAILPTYPHKTYYRAFWTSSLYTCQCSSSRNTKIWSWSGLFE